MGHSPQNWRNLRDGHKLSARHLHALASTTAGEVFVALGLGGQWLLPAMANSPSAESETPAPLGANTVSAEGDRLNQLCVVTECGWMAQTGSLPLPAPRQPTETELWLCFEGWSPPRRGEPLDRVNGSQPAPRAQWTEGGPPDREGPALLLFQRGEDDRLLPIPLPAVVGAHGATRAAAERLSEAATALRTALTPKSAKLLGLSGEHLHHLDALMAAIDALPIASATQTNRWREMPLAQALAQLKSLSRQVVGWRLHALAVDASGGQEPPSPAAIHRLSIIPKKGMSEERLLNWCDRGAANGQAIKEWFETLTKSILGISAHLGGSSIDWVVLAVQGRPSGKAGELAFQFERPCSEPFTLRVWLRGNVADQVRVTMGGTRTLIRGTQAKDRSSTRYEHSVPAGAIEMLTVIAPQGLNHRFEWKQG